MMDKYIKRIVYRISIPVRYDWNKIEWWDVEDFINFNSSKVRLELYNKFINLRLLLFQFQ